MLNGNNINDTIKHDRPLLGSVNLHFKNVVVRTHNVQMGFTKNVILHILDCGIF